MFKKIIWATDGSDPADLALPYVKAIASKDDASIVVFHSVVAMLGPRAGGQPISANEDELKAKIEKQVETLADEGYDVRLKVFGGDTLHGAAYDIARAADQEHADLIIAGTRGHTVLGGLLLGSVTQRLLHLAHCPVLVVPSAVASGDSTVSVERDQAVA
jgi:nucleotide-binding universal stress UspA family protein